MTLHGRNFLGPRTSAMGSAALTAADPAQGSALDPPFYQATEDEIDRAVTLAASSAAAFQAVSADHRADFLDSIAEQLLALGDDWIARAHQETGLPTARLTGERARTVGQLRLFAATVREGSWVDARIDRAQPARRPVPRPDLRRMLVPIGPVAVFGASNFPFAFSVAGGDTASALAAGCPVIVKAHPAHPGTSEMAAGAVLAAAGATRMPDGVFSMLHGGADVGLSLIRQPALAAAGFTGSLAAGRALCAAAAARPMPIPVHAEMSSINPVFVLPGALTVRGDALAAGLAQAVTLGVGQFCTNPGLVVGPEGPALTALATRLAQEASAAPGLMLTAGISEAYRKGLARMESLGAARIGDPGPQPGGASASPVVFRTDAATFQAAPGLAEEVFGPATLVVACDTPAEMYAVARSLAGQLTATVHGEPDEMEAFAGLIAVLADRVGRLIFNGYPTGVEVSSAMQHGGPYPATSDARFTSVGTAAILRFARPLCWQDAPPALLPPELQDANPRHIFRRVDGDWTQEALV